MRETKSLEELLKAFDNAKATEFMTYIEELLATKTVKQEATIQWHLQGSFKCPYCGKYSNLYSNGRGDSIQYRLSCDKDGVLVKTSYTGWKHV